MIPGEINLKDLRKPKHKTSVTIDSALWDEFDTQIRKRLGVRDYSPALEILIREWLKGPSNSEPANLSGTSGSVLNMVPVPSGSRYSDPQLAVLEELLARAWEDKRSDLARTIISLLRIYGDSSKVGD